MKKIAIVCRHDVYRWFCDQNRLPHNNDKFQHVSDVKDTLGMEFSEVRLIGPYDSSMRDLADEAELRVR